MEKSQIETNETVKQLELRVLELTKDKKRLERMLKSLEGKVAFLSNLNCVYIRMIQTESKNKQE